MSKTPLLGRTLGAATTASLGLLTLLAPHAHAQTDNVPAASATADHVVTKVKILLDLNGDKFELNGAELTPDTMLKVNGKEQRFGDLSAAQQQQLRAMRPTVDINSLVSKAMASRGTSTSSSFSKSTSITLLLDGDKVELSGTELRPDVVIKVNGKEGRYGDLSVEQQQQIYEAVQKLSKIDTHHAGTHVFTKMKFDINGDKIELDGTELKPDTLLKVNGKDTRFGDLTPAQQQPLQKAVKHVPAIDVNALVTKAISTSTTGSGGTSTVTSKMILMDIDGDKIELGDTVLTPDTKVTVNGKDGRFGDLSAAKQQQIQKAVEKIPAVL